MEESNVKPRKVNVRMIIVLIVLAIFIITELITNRAEYLKIKEIGESYTSIFFTNFYMKHIVFGVSFFVAYILFFINNKIIKRGMKYFFEKEGRQVLKLPNKSVSLIMGLLSGIFSSKFLYTKLITCMNASYFGIYDPVFGNDIGYYMFILPFIKTLLIFLLVSALIMVIYTAIYYVISINVCFKNGVDLQDLKESTFVKQIKFWAIVFGIIMSLYLLVTAQDILTGDMLTIKDDKGTALVGAGFADSVIKLWGYRIFAVVVFISIIKIIKNASVSKIKKCIKAASVIPIYLVVMFVVLIYFQEVYVGSSELDKEKNYIGYNIEATKAAFGIDIDQKLLSDYQSLTPDVVNQNIDVLFNIPIVNEQVISQTVTDVQDNSTYYDYSNSNLGIYNVNGNKRLISLTAREIINDSNRTYNTSTYEYTHGYSVVSSLPSQIDENGYVKILESDFELEKNILNIEEPRIYFGLETDNLVIVNSKYGNEYDYPISVVNYVENEYDGKAGMKLNFLDRIAVGVTSGNYGIIVSKYLDENSKIITTRNIIERAQTLLPYIKYDKNPYLVVTDEGRLVWVIDGYTTSNEYPYSQSIVITNENGMKETINYIRNSVKVLVDAYDGTTEFYITDRTDPVIMMYKNLYPDLFMDINKSIPESVSKNLKYPQYLFDVQSQVIATYHDITEDMLYRADDIWSLASDGEKQIASKYTMLKTEDSKHAELGVVATYTKQGKGSLTSYLVGTTGDSGINKLSLYKLPSDSTILGISQFNTLIEEDGTIASEIEALNVSGVNLVRDIIIVPINNTLLYVEPIYQVRLNENETQILKKVIVASGNKVAIGDSLEEALQNLLSDNHSVRLEYVDMEDIAQVIDSIIEANTNLKESLDSNNLEMIGKDLATLETLLDQLEKLRAKELEEQTNPKDRFGL